MKLCERTENKPCKRVVVKRNTEDSEKSRKNKIIGYVYRLIGTQEADYPLCTVQEFRSVIGLDRPQSSLEFLKDDSPLPLSEKERLFALDVFQGEWKKVPNSLSKITRANALQRENQLPPLELLEIKQKGSPAIKTALARAYLGGWFRSASEPIVASAENEKAFDRAVELITVAAQKGEPEACFLIATLKRPLPSAQRDNLADAAPKNSERNHTRFKQEFVIQDEMERLNYLRYAASRGFEPARDKLLEDQWMAEGAFDYEKTLNSFDFDPELHEFYSERTRDLLRQADQGDAVSQRKIGVAILESDESIVNFLPSSERGATPARYWLELAAGAGDLEAKFYLTTRFEKGGNKIDLLHSLINSELPPDLRAVSCLELGKIFANDTSYVGSQDLAETLFKFALCLDKSNSIACFALADLTLLKANATQDELRLALDFFDSQQDDPEALFRSGLMRLRGQGCLSNRDASKEFFEKSLFAHPLAPLHSYISFNHSAEDTPIHMTVIQPWARMVLALGWGGSAEWKRVARQTIWNEISMGSNDKNLSPVTENDVTILLDHNPEYEKYREFLKERLDWREKKRQQRAGAILLLEKNGHLSATSEWDANPAGKDLLAEGEYFGFADMKCFFQGLLYCLRERSLLDIEVLDQYWHDDCSLAESFIKGCLYAFGRFGIDRKIESVGHLERAIEIAEIAKNAPDRGPLFDHKFALQVQSYSRDKLMSIQLELRNKELEKTNNELIQKSLALNNANIELERKTLELEDLMGMFAHKFRGPVDSVVFNAEHRLDKQLFINIGRTMTGLLDIFSCVSTSSDILKPKLANDCIGSVTLSQIVRKSLWLALVQLLPQRKIDLMSPHYFAYAIRTKRIAEAVTFNDWQDEDRYLELQRSLSLAWELEIGAAMGSEMGDAVVDWCRQHLFEVRLTGIDESSLRCAPFGAKESVLVIVMTELFVNAIKHFNTARPGTLELSWSETDEGAVFTCKNPSNLTSRSHGRGSGRGHGFLRLIARNIDAEFSPPGTSDESITTFRIPSSLIRCAKS